jgi:tyrosinase
MKLFGALVGFALHVTSTLAATFPITGATSGVSNQTGARPFRQELSTFQNSGPPFDLYILALQQLQQAGQSGMLSYFQFAGDE